MMKLVDGELVPLTDAEIAQRKADEAATSVAPKPPMPSPREWLERLAPATQQAVSQAALANPAILLWLLKASGSSQIDVTLPETVNGVGALVTAGVLTAADQATLLAP
jgi:hypothetical protein